MLYAVYDFLRRECGCGFFLSGEYLPQQSPRCPRRSATGLCYPRLPIRWTMADQGTAVHYSAWAWSAGRLAPATWTGRSAHRLRQIALPYGTPGQGPGVGRVWRGPRGPRTRADAEIAAPNSGAGGTGGDCCGLSTGGEGKVPARLQRQAPGSPVPGGQVDRLPLGVVSAPRGPAVRRDTAQARGWPGESVRPGQATGHDLVRCLRGEGLRQGPGGPQGPPDQLRAERLASTLRRSPGGGHDAGQLGLPQSGGMDSGDEADLLPGVPGGAWSGDVRLRQQYPSAVRGDRLLLGQ